jgi:hypothetical protein
MYARTVKMNLKPNTAVEFNTTFERDILPMLRKRTGFADELAFVSADGKGAVAISLWDGRENAESYGRETYPQVLAGLSKVIEGTPEVSSFEVASSTFHKIHAPARA